MSDAAVYAFAKALLAGQTTEPELQFLLTVCRHETKYTTAWPVGAGAGSNNWGAITATLADPHFDHVDTHADGSSFVSHFKTYPSMQHGLLDAAAVVLKPNVRAAANRGDGAGAAQAMHDNKYYEATVSSYVAALQRNYPLLVNGAQLQPALRFDGTGVSSSSSGLLLLAAAFLLFGGKY